MARMRISMDSRASFRDIFKSFVLSKKAEGLSEKTLTTYQQHLSAIGKHLDLGLSIYSLNKNYLDAMISSMRDAGLSSNTIRSYTATLKSFFLGVVKKKS